MFPIVIRFAFPRFAPHRLASRPALHVVGRGADGAACLPRDVMTAAGCGRGHALYIERCRGLSAVPLFAPLCPTASNRMATGDRNGSDVIQRGGMAAYPVM